jgi:hypothetical protein
MAREGLRRDLTVALNQAAKTQTIVHCSGVSVKTNGHTTLVNLSVFPVPLGKVEAGSYQYLITLQEAKRSMIPNQVGLDNAFVEAQNTLEKTAKSGGFAHLSTPG